MSVVSTARVEDQDGLHNGQKKRPLSIIEEIDGDDADNDNIRVKDISATVNNNNSKAIETTTIKPNSSQVTTKAGSNNNGVIKHEVKKKPKPPNVDTTKANMQTPDTKTMSPRPKIPISPESKIASKILHFSKNTRIVPKPGPKTKVPQKFGPRQKSSSPSPSPTRVKGTTSSASKNGDPRFSSCKSPTCSQPKNANPKPKSDQSTDEEDVSRNTKNTVRRTVSMLEGNTASSSQSARHKVRAEYSKRKTSKGETSALTSVESDTPISSKDDTSVCQSENAQNNTSNSLSQKPPSRSSSPQLPQPETSSNNNNSSPESTNTISQSSSKDTKIDSKPNQGLSDSQGLARVREATESLHSKPTAPSFPKSSPSPPIIRIPFPVRQSPKLAKRPLSDTFSLSMNNSKSSVQMNCNLLSVPGQFSNKGDSGNSDSENEDNQSQSLAGDKSRHSPRSPFLAPKFHRRRGSYFFKRRMSSESLASLSETESADNAEDQIPLSASDFNQLKETADRLRLSTRRPSVLQWRQQYVESPGSSPTFRFTNGLNGDSKDERLTSERKQKIDEALEWLRNELQEMRSQDQLLARQLLSIRNDIHQLKLRRCTAAHQEMLDDFKLEYEEMQELSVVLDIPQPIYENNPLKHIGVTRLNISARRFSAC